MQKLRAAMAQMNMTIPSGLRSDEVVAWALGAHLADCVLDRRENKKLLEELKGILDDGKGGGIAPLSREMHGYLAPSMAKDRKAQAAWASVTNFFDSAAALLTSRRAIMWVRIASAAIVALASVSLGPKIAHQIVDLIDWVELVL